MKADKQLTQTEDAGHKCDIVINNIHQCMWIKKVQVVNIQIEITWIQNGNSSKYIYKWHKINS